MEIRTAGAEVGAVLEDGVGPEGGEAPGAGGVKRDVEEGAVDPGVQQAIEAREIMPAHVGEGEREPAEPPARCRVEAGQVVGGRADARELPVEDGGRITFGVGARPYAYITGPVVAVDQGVRHGIQDLEQCRRVGGDI